jgi:hypothetical protein
LFSRSALSRVFPADSLQAAAKIMVRYTLIKPLIYINNTIS